MEKTNQPTTPAQKMIAEALNKILIEGLRLYAYHGVLEQERTIGAYFTIDAEIYADFSQAIDTDELAGTIDYSSFSFHNPYISQTFSIHESLHLHISNCVRLQPLNATPHSIFNLF